MTVSRAATLQQGFSLTEMAVVLVIVALLIGGMLVPWGTQQEVRQAADTDKTLAEVREALLGFAVANGRLPCPDTNQDGGEDTQALTTTNNSPLPGQSTQVYSGCAADEGDLPFSTLGVPGVDGWGRRFRYRVTPAFTQVTVTWSGLDAAGSRIAVAPAFTLNQEGAITIQGRGDDPASTPAVEAKFATGIAAKIPAVVISHGRNGYGARAVDGVALPAPPAGNTDEVLNANAASPTKTARSPAPIAAGCSDTVEGGPLCEFDDIVIWLSPHVLFNRLIAAGRLP